MDVEVAAVAGHALAERLRSPDEGKATRYVQAWARYRADVVFWPRYEN